MLPGPPCRLTRSRCGCGRARRSKRRISACACARARRASVYPLLRSSSPCRSSLLALASFEIATWLPTLVALVAKPWLDRTILFVLSRAAFGQRRTLGDLWRAQRQVWWRQLFLTWTLRRLSPWRSLTQPVYQLEGLRFWRSCASASCRFASQAAAPALMMTASFSLAEIGLSLALVSLVLLVRAGGQSAGPRRSCSRLERAPLRAADRADRLCDRGAVPRAVLRRGGIRDVSEPPRRARGVGHRAGVSTCVRGTEQVAAELAAGLRECVVCSRASAMPMPAAVEAARADCRHHAGQRAEITRALDDGQGRSEPRHRAHDQARCAGAASRTRRSRDSACPSWLDLDRRPVHLDRRSRRACSSGCAIAVLAALLVLFVMRVLARAATGLRRARRVRRADSRAGSGHPAGEPARRHRRRRPRSCGIAASTARRWRCSTAACCRGSRTSTTCRSAIRAPKATAWRSPRVISKRQRNGYATRLVRVWQRASTAAEA